MQRNSTLDSIKSKTDHIQGTFFSKTGNGKSSTGTTLFWSLGSSEEFQFGRSVTPVTSDSKTKTITCSNGLKLSLTDHPGLFDSRGHEQEIKNLRGTALENSRNEGYHFICLVFNITQRFDETERIALEVIDEFYKEIKDHIIIILTHGDCLQEEEEEQRLLLEWKTAISDALKCSPNYLHVVTNHPRHSTPSGKDRKQSANEILESIKSIVEHTEARKFKTRQIEEKKIIETVRNRAKSRNLGGNEFAKVFEAVVTILKVFGGGGGGCISRECIVETKSGKKKVKDLMIGDMIRGKAGWSRVILNREIGKRICIEYNGLIATPDHLLLPEYKQLKEIAPPNYTLSEVNCLLFDPDEALVSDINVSGHSVNRYLGFLAQNLVLYLPSFLVDSGFNLFYYVEDINNYMESLILKGKK